MPFFDFHCADCGRDFELMLSIAERDGKRRACPECGSTRIQRKITAPQVVGGKGSSAADCGSSGFG